MSYDHAAIRKAYPNVAKIGTNGVRDKDGNTITIEQSQVDAARVELDKLKYKATRALAYPDIGDQLDDLYKQGVFSADMTAKLKKVKDDNPKP